MSERVLIIGAGVAGLWSAMALAGEGREILVLDRDPAPPAAGPDEVFETWSRRGVGQLRHSHAFLARLRLLARDRHPQFLAELLAAGCRELGFEGSLMPRARARFKPKAIDGDLTILTSRRTTLELVIRRYVERLPGVEIRPRTFVKALAITPGRPPAVTGVILDDERELGAEIVIDAAGRNSRWVDQLVAAGAHIVDTTEPCGVIYFTRHYRLHPGAEEPPRGKLPTTGDLGYLKFGVFPADNGWFSVTLCVPEVEEELRKAIVEPQRFDEVCRRLPGVARWIEPDRAHPASPVYGMGQLENRWRDPVADGAAPVLGFFPVGDSLVQTNPLYGRGCSFAAVSAELLADVLAATSDPARRLVAYRNRVTAELRPYYDVMRRADRSAIRRARAEVLPGKAPGLRRRLVRSFLADGVAPAIRGDPDLLRAFLRGFHMLEHPQAWLKRPGNLAKVLRAWARGRARNADLYPAKAAPGRAEMLEAIGLSPLADRERLLAA